MTETLDPTTAFHCSIKAVKDLTNQQDINEYLKEGYVVLACVPDREYATIITRVAWTKDTPAPRVRSPRLF